MSARFKSLRNRYFLVPLIALILMLLSWSASLANPYLAILGGVLVAAVFTAVHHAEVVALKVGEPFGSLILALAVTVIEVGMIVVLILGAPEANQSLARDTVFAAIMITTNGIVGISLLIKTLRQRVAIFNASGVSGALAALVALSTLCLVLPTVTISTPGPTVSYTHLTLPTKRIV